MSDATTVYRFYDKADRLIYLGTTYHVPLRFRAHEARDWWLSSARTTLTHYDTREEALTAEKEGIQAEHPVYNVQFNDRMMRVGRYLRERGRRRQRQHAVSVSPPVETVIQRWSPQEMPYEPRGDGRRWGPSRILRLADLEPVTRGIVAAALAAEAAAGRALAPAEGS